MTAIPKKASFKEKAKAWLEIIKPNWERAEVSSNSAELAYFILLSIAPILLVVANMIPFLPISAAEILPYIKTALPSDIYSIVQPMLMDFLSQTRGGVISIGLIASLWSTSKAFNATQLVLNDVYGVEKRKNFIIVRVMSFVINVAIVGVVGVIMFAFVFGEQILRFIENILNIKLTLIEEILSFRWLILLAVLLVVLILMYSLLPNHSLSFIYSLPGAVFSAVGWLILSQGFSLYVSVAGGAAAGSGAFGVFIILMLWLYFSAIVFLLGALINVIYFQYKNDKTVAEFKKEDEEKGKTKEDYLLDAANKQRRKLTKIKTIEEHEMDKDENLPI
ncbi:YihY/virulence factor BrkB family protein [Carnobacterium funditum]|uniref:YihY/virulence factor BrkB family protein n=1 Tax=Carnobacterium funditum TaxID=2752 RepID=UPI00054CE39B|nr:YihY/virulence factor BrkB family protein [Carnobacterium funditum]